MMDLANISSLQRDSSGIWISHNKESISFPPDGNASRADKEENSFWYDHRNRCISEVINNYPPSGEILDVGGGNGRVSLYLQNSGHKVTLLEPELAAAKEARTNGVVDVVCSTFSGLQLRERTVSAIGLFDVLEHIKDDVSFLRELKTALSIKGILYITVPAFCFMWSEADHQAGHYRRYTAQRLSSVLHDAGYRVMYVSYYFSLLVLPILFMRALPYRLGIKRTDPNWRHKHHQNKNSKLGGSMRKGLNFEINMIHRKSNIPFGSSCILVAQSID